MNILAFFQRLTSPIGQANVKAAWAELTVLVGMVTFLIASFKAKDWTSIFTQGADFYTGILILIADIRNILSSNEKAVKDTTLPKVTGTVNP